MASESSQSQTYLPATDLWRTALWLLEAHPPTRRARVDAASPLRRRKVAAGVDAITRFVGDANGSLQVEVVPRAPFVFALMKWLQDRGVEERGLLDFHIMQNGTFRQLLKVSGSPRAAYAILVAFCRARVAEPDTAFTDSEIRAATVRELLGGR